jgi:predicted nucleic acid-binding protein
VVPERAFADTNLFLRYLTNDVPAQADAVERLLARAAEGDLVLVTTPMVIAEIVWTLESFYGLSKSDIRDRVVAVLNTPGIEANQEHLLLDALESYADKNVDFADAYNAAWMREQGIEAVYTFDRRHFGRLDDVTPKVP